MKSILKLSVLLSAVFLCSCAGFYHAVNPQTINFPQVSKEDKVPVSYRFDVLRDAGNKKMAKKEIKRCMKVVAVKITNNTDSVINVQKDLEFVSSNKSLELISPVDIQNQIRQSSEAYAFYFIGGLTLAPLDIAVFGGIGLGNILVASQANANLLKELTTYDIRNTNINPKESITGIIGYRSSYSDPIYVKLKEKNDIADSPKKIKDTTIDTKPENEKPLDKISNDKNKNELSIGDSVQFYDFGTNTNYHGKIIELKSKIAIVEYTSFNQKKTVEKDIKDITKLN